MKFDTDQIKENLDDVIDHGRERIANLANYLNERVRAEAWDFAKSAQRRWKRGKRQLLRTNETVVDKVKENPAATSAILLAIIGVAVALFVLNWRCSRDD